MKGRKPYPFEVINSTNSGVRKTKKELREREANQPQPKSFALFCPRHLSEEAKKEWRRLIKFYKELDHQLVSDMDANALEIYCEAVATYRRAMAEVHKTAPVYFDKRDERIKKNPWLSVANEAAMQVKKYGEVLLLDPVSRARASLTKEKRDQDDPFQQFLNRRDEYGT